VANERVLSTLIITGQLSAEHDPKSSALLRRMLESTGRFKVRITEEFRGCTAETLASYDLVILNYDGDFPTGNPPHPAITLGERSEQALLEFVRSGKGIIFNHSAIWNTPWPPEFHRVMGGWTDITAGSRKNPILDFPIKKSNVNHPITAGLDPAWNTVQEDLFAGIVWHPEARVEVLATAFDDLEGYRHIQPHAAYMIPKEGPEAMRGVNQDEPVAWTHHYGKGRVFVITIGHGIDTIRRPGYVALYCRAAEWAATGQVTIAPPDLTGENRRRVWPYYAPISVVEYSAMVP
jgi:uncharacterized protein